MVVTELLDMVRERGLSIRVDGSVLSLVGPKEMKTPALMKVLVRHRGKLSDYFGANKAKAEPADNGKCLRFYRMKSGMLLHRIEGNDREYPPYGADAWAMSDKGPWQDLGGKWNEQDGKVIWQWQQ